jgi:hypothetical protein
MKCSHIRAQLHPDICNSSRPFLPISPDSSGLVCDKHGFSDRQFDDKEMPQGLTETGSHLKLNPIYVLFSACNTLGDDLETR